MITDSATTQRMPKLIKSCLASVAKLHLWQLYRLLGTNEVDPSLQIQYFVKIQSKRIFGFFINVSYEQRTNAAGAYFFLQIVLYVSSLYFRSASSIPSKD